MQHWFCHECWNTWASDDIPAYCPRCATEPTTSPAAPADLPGKIGVVLRCHIAGRLKAQDYDDLRGALREITAMLEAERLPFKLSFAGRQLLAGEKQNHFTVRFGAGIQP